MQRYKHVNMDSKYEMYISDTGLDYVSDFGRHGSMTIFGKDQVTFTLIMVIWI